MYSKMRKTKDVICHADKSGKSKVTSIKIKFKSEQIGQPHMLQKWVIMII